MSENRDRHIKDVSLSQREREVMAKKIIGCILTNYTRKDILKIYFLLKNGHDIVFTETPVRVQGLERDLPKYLQKILSQRYPVEEESRGEDEV